MQCLAAVGHMDGRGEYPGHGFLSRRVAARWGQGAGHALAGRSPHRVPLPARDGFPPPLTSVCSDRQNGK